jgi:hypothetical protein
MLTEHDLDAYLIWCGLAPQSRKDLGPQFPRAISWLAEMGVTESPLYKPDRWSSLKWARADDLLHLWELQARPTRDHAAEHEIRNLLARLGAGVRPYKA